MMKAPGNATLRDILQFAGSALVIFLLFSSCGGRLVEDNLFSDADCTIADCTQSPGAPGGGRQGFMLVGYGNLHRAEGRYRAYVRFELNGIDPSSITSAQLRLYKRGSREDTLRVFAVAEDSWDEYETVWDNAPPMGGQVASGYCGIGWNTIDVTEYVKAQTDDIVTFGLRVEHDSVPGLGFDTRESGAPPTLVISHRGKSAGDAPAADVKSTSKLAHGVYIDDGSGNLAGYPDIKSAASAVKPGQEIVLGPGIYYESPHLAVDGTAETPLKLRGDGDPRPVIDGTLSERWQPDGEQHVDRALLYVTGDYWTLEHIEVRNAHPYGEGRDNSTCIYVHDASHVTIRDCAVYFGGDGIFSTSSTDNITLEYNEVAYNSFMGGAYEHGHYMNGRGWATVRFNHIHHNGGQNFKSRNEKCLFAYNYVHSPGNYQLDFVRARLEDQDAILIGNVVVTDNHPTNPTQMMVFGEDRHGGSLEMYNNTFINYYPRNCCFVHMWFPEGVEVLGTTLTASNNLFYQRSYQGPMTFLRSEKPVPASGGNNWFVKGVEGIPRTMKGTIYGENPGLMDMDNEDYRPAARSPLVDAGIELGQWMPEYQYLHPRSKTERKTAGPAPDIGAFEFGAQWR